MEMEPLYKPQGVEERWQRAWEDEGLYQGRSDPSREPYVDAHPPPTSPVSCTSAMRSNSPSATPSCA